MVIQFSGQGRERMDALQSNEMGALQSNRASLAYEHHVLCTQVLYSISPHSSLFICKYHTSPVSLKKSILLHASMFECTIAI